MIKPRIGIVHFNCYPVMGGVELVVENHARFFAEYDYDVTLIVANGEQFDRRIPVVNIHEIDSRYPKNLKIARELERGIPPEGFDSYAQTIKEKLAQAFTGLELVIIHNVLVKDLNYPAVKALREIISERSSGSTKQYPRFINWAHDPSASAYNAPAELRDHERFPYSLINTPAQGAELVTISRQRRNELAELYGMPAEEIRIIPDGVSLNNFLGLKTQTTELWEHLDLFKQDFVFLTPSRVVDKKNIEAEIRLVAALKQNGKNIKLLITGPPTRDLNINAAETYLQGLKRLALELDVEENIVFLYEYRTPEGEPLHITIDILRDLYLLSDCLLILSREEGFGIPLLEAGILKTPIVCSNIEAFRELGGDDALFVQLDEAPETTAAKITEYLEKSHRTHMFKKGLLNFSWRNIFLKQIEPYILEGK